MNDFEKVKNNIYKLIHIIKDDKNHDNDKKIADLFTTQELFINGIQTIEAKLSLLESEIKTKDAQLQNQSEVMATDMMRIEATREFLKGETGLDVIGVSNALLKLGFDAEGKRIYSNSKS
jgi:hypothetical protein